MIGGHKPRPWPEEDTTESRERSKDQGEVVSVEGEFEKSGELEFRQS